MGPRCGDEVRGPGRAVPGAGDGEVVAAGRGHVHQLVVDLDAVRLRRRRVRIPRALVGGERDGRAGRGAHRGAGGVDVVDVPGHEPLHPEQLERGHAYSSLTLPARAARARIRLRPIAAYAVARAPRIRQDQEPALLIAGLAAEADALLPDDD